MSYLKKNLKLITITAFALPFLAGCGSPDTDQMKAGLIRSGMPAAQAECFAQKAADTVDGDAYNYMAKLMNEGVKESQAKSRTRRKYGPEFQKPLKEARKACVQ
nr:hypothetical protein [uncultured Desulfobacter sp.]